MGVNGFSQKRKEEKRMDEKSKIVWRILFGILLLSCLVFVNLDGRTLQPQS